MTTLGDKPVPAIAGGKPAKTVPFTRAKRYGEEELQQLREALDQGTLFYAQGKKVSTLEQEFAKMVGRKYAVSCSSGTASIHCAMMAAGISPGDEVIVPPITDMGSLIPVLTQGGIPVFADVDPATYNMSVRSVAGLITPKTRAVLCVHLAGTPADLDAMVALCKERGIMLIEDCAQAFGCMYDGKPVGTFGEMGCFSLNEFKHISCGDGGITVTDDEKLARKLRLCTDKAYDRSPDAQMRNPTFLAANYRMTELQGAVAIAQLPKLDSIVERRRSWAQRLTQRLSGIPGLTLPVEPAKGKNSIWFYMMRVREADFGTTADKFAEAMVAEGVPMGAHYIGRCVYEYPVFINHSAYDHAPHPFSEREYKAGLCPEAEKLLEECVVLQINEGFTDQDLEETVLAIKRIAEHFGTK